MALDLLTEKDLFDQHTHVDAHSSDNPTAYFRRTGAYSPAIQMCRLELVTTSTLQRLQGKSLAEYMQTEKLYACSNTFGR